MGIARPGDTFKDENARTHHENMVKTKSSNPNKWQKNMTKWWTSEGKKHWESEVGDNIKDRVKQQQDHYKKYKDK